MPNPSVQASKSTQAREQVMSAALKLFAARGYFNTSIPDIVRESGVSTGSIYHHFGDKEGVANTLFNNIVERMEQAIEDIRKSYSTTHDRCKTIMALLFTITEDEPELMNYMLYAKHKEFLPNVAPICSAKPFQLMLSIVAEGMQTGEVREMNSTVAAVSVFGGAIRLIQMRLDGVIMQPLHDYLNETWDSAWRAVAM